MAPRADRRGKVGQGSPTVLLAVLAAAAILAGALFWQLNREISSTPAAGAGDPAASVQPGPAGGQR